jgi:phytoene desaturase
MDEQTYDIVVIGSGVGGMCAGALLAGEGYRVLVTERLPRIGGRCSTVDYRGYKCTTGVIGPEMGGILQEVFDRVSAAFDVRPAGPPHYLIYGEVFAMPVKGGLHTLLSKASGNREEVKNVMGAFSKALKWKEPSQNISLRDWLLQFTQDDAILGIFQAMVSAATLVNAHEMSARDFFIFLKKMKGVSTFGFCPGGSIALMESLARVIKENQGEIWTRASALHILLEEDTVQGAIVKREEAEIRVRAPVVISNCGPLQTAQLVGRQHLDQGYLTELDKTVRPATVIAIHLAADRPLLKENYLIVTGARRINAIFQPTSVCPDLAPVGRHYLLAGAAPESSLPPLNAKKEIDLCMEDLRDLLPGFDDHAEILLTGTFHGAWPAMHSWPGRDMPVKTPIVNLYHVGDGVKSPGMVAAPAAAETALRVVKDIEEHHLPAR